MQKSVGEVAEQFIEFLEKCPSPFHAVATAASLLSAAGFKEIRESDPWTITPLQKYFVTRNKSSIFAFAVGGSYKPGNGFSIIAAHTDSPCLMVKPNSRLCNSNCLQVGVEPYGGALWRTWFDRDLTVAGRIIAKQEGTGIFQKLVHIKRPIMTIPNLAIHLDRESNEKFVFNKEDNLRPILATKVYASGCDKTKLQECPSQTAAVADANQEEKSCHHSALMDALAKEANVAVEQIIDLELCVVDTQPPV